SACRPASVRALLSVHVRRAADTTLSESRQTANRGRATPSVAGTAHRRGTGPSWACCRGVRGARKARQAVRGKGCGLVTEAGENGSGRRGRRADGHERAEQNFPG